MIGIGRRGRKLTVGCPKGKWSAKRKRCKVGMRGVNLLTPKRRKGKRGIAGNPGFSDIRPGDRVTIATYHGGKVTGRVVMQSGDGRGWVLNLGGRHGTPGLAYPENTIKVSKSKSGPTYLNSGRKRHMRRKRSNPELLIVNNPRHKRRKRRKNAPRRVLYRRKRRTLGQLVKLVGKRKAKSIWGGKGGKSKRSHRKGKGKHARRRHKR